MDPYRLGEMEERLARLIWENAPVRTGELTRLCEEAFSWKRTTTYTMLKRLCDRGLFANEGGTVVVRTTEADFRAAQGQRFLEETFGGSLPGFLAAFSRRQKLKEKDIAALKQLIDTYEEEPGDD